MDREPVELSLDVERASVFDVYDELLVPLCFQGYADDLATRLGDVRRGDVLVVACGTGVDTRVLADALPASVAITATDLVPGMVERAQQRGTSRAVTWEVANAVTLPYDDASFDVVVCQFGAMFFPAKADAFAEAARVLRPDGRFELAVWDCIDRNDFGATVAAAMSDIFPDDPPVFLERMPYSYHAPDAILTDLVTGGFAASTELERVGHVARAASPEVVATAFCGGTPLRDQLQAGGTDRLGRAIDGATRALADRFGPADLVGGTAALVATAAKG
ncbi:MAG TPA: class I SAM-dependent methyltransferase [Acidimicrobiia bacterium]